jgi:hypothetical protein
LLIHVSPDHASSQNHASANHARANQLIFDERQQKGTVRLDRVDCLRMLSETLVNQLDPVFDLNICTPGEM